MHIYILISGKEIDIHIVAETQQQQYAMFRTDFWETTIN